MLHLSKRRSCLDNRDHLNLTNYVASLRAKVFPSKSFPGGVRTDFYELYWADLTAGSTWEEFSAWVRGLLLRPLARVPQDVRTAWVLLWIATLFVVAITVLSLLPAGFWKSIGVERLADWHWLLLLISALLGTGLHRTASETFGRVVRYTKADPDNIAARRKVRERGLKLLNSIHDGNYKRIIIVAHSLGAILAYDLLSYFWAEHEAARQVSESCPEFDVLCELEKATAAVDQADPTPSALQAYYKAQRRLRDALARRPVPLARQEGAALPREPQDSRWLITDLITIGSPLTHADFLIASSDEDLVKRKFQRELLRSPPLREELDPKTFDLAKATHKLPVGSSHNTSKLVSFPLRGSPGVWELHHAAPFAVVRWTNIYDLASLVFRGDIIGGPVADKLGPAIVDINLRSVRGQATCFTHTKYWEVDEEPLHIEALRWAINLLDRELPDGFVSLGTSFGNV